MADNDESIEELPSRTLGEAEQYYFAQAYKEPVESIARIEEDSLVRGLKNLPAV